MIKSSDAIYQVLYAAMEAANKPLSCVELLDIPDVGATARARWGGDARDRVSDTLGFMWRRQTLDKFPTDMVGRGARWKYALRNKFPSDPALNPVGKLVAVNKQKIKISQQEDEVIIEFEHFVLTVKPK